MSNVTKEQGYPLARPESREEDDLDKVIEKVIESLPHEVRMYPDIYSWKITDAILAYMLKGE